MKPYKLPAGTNYSSWNDVFKDSQPMPFSGFNTGRVHGPLKPYTQADSLPSGCDATKTFDYAVMVFHFKHPQKGSILIDSGFDRSFYDKPSAGNLPKVVREFQKENNISYLQKKGEDLLYHLEKMDINPSCVFLTHMHPDHTAGLPALPTSCRIYYGNEEDTPYYHLITGGHFEGKNDIQLLDMEKGVFISPFDKVLDIFGDGTFFAISTPGHTKGHVSYLINTTPNPKLVIGDAELSNWGMEYGIYMNSDYGEKGEVAVRNSAKRIREFCANYPQAEIWFSHDEQPRNGNN